jgi:hypothetical protein
MYIWSSRRQACRVSRANTSQSSSRSMSLSWQIKAVRAGRLLLANRSAVTEREDGRNCEAAMRSSLARTVRRSYFGSRSWVNDRRTSVACRQIFGIVPARQRYAGGGCAWPNADYCFVAVNMPPPVTVPLIVLPWTRPVYTTSPAVNVISSPRSLPALRGVEPSVPETI